MPDYYDELETRSRQDRESALFHALPDHIEHARQKAPAYGALFEGLKAKNIDSRAALAELPVTRKTALLERQSEAPPFGGFAAATTEEFGHIFASPGPIYEPEARRDDYWRMARALFAAGIRPGELVHNTFSYHFTPAGFMLESGAHALGCPVFPAGIGQTEQQIQAISQLKPPCYVGTPSFLKIILDKAEESAADGLGCDRGAPVVVTDTPSS